jgi:hypothetical protein
MAFKLGKEKRNYKDSSNTKIFRKKLGDGVLGEANMDGSIYIDKSVPQDMVNYVATHEAQHRTAMQLGTETYDDNAVYYKGEVWPRGNGYIIDPRTGKKYPEGDRRLPWEANKI